MKREFLKSLDLDNEIIEKIYTEYGKEISSTNEELSSLRKELEGYKEKEKAYDSNLESYKSQITALNKTIDDNKKSLENLKTITNERDDYKAQVELSGANCKKEFMKFVASEVKGLVDDKTDFNTTLENYKKENPQYFGDTTIKKVQTSPTLNGGNTQPQTTDNIMNDILRGKA